MTSSCSINRLLWLFVGTFCVRKSAYCQDCIQSSTSNRDGCELAYDGNDRSCSRTGLSTGAWWKMKLNSPRMISRFGVKGSIPFFEARVGNNSDEWGTRGGFQSNLPCVVNNLAPVTLGAGLQSFSCSFPLYGSIFSIKLVDPTVVDALVLCEVKLE